MDVLSLTHVLEDLRPDAHRDLAQVRFFQEKHVGAGLPNSTTDAERQLGLDDAPVVREPQEIELAAYLEMVRKVLNSATMQKHYLSRR
jgi:hypothetical protein